ncbi:MAG: hypothetical protein ABIH64_00785 [Nanoarchaeota archaeon]
MHQNNLDRRLREYVKENLARGYSRKPIKQALLNAGYSAGYANKLTNNKTKQIVLAAALFMAAVFLLQFALKDNGIVGFAVAPSFGCCDSICQETPEDLCPGNFYSGEECSNIEPCSIGCCIDREEYCFENYLSSNCERNNNNFIKRSCKDVYNCSVIIEQPAINGYYGFNQIYDPNDINSLIFIEPAAQFYSGTVEIGYFIHNSEDAGSVKARIKHNGAALDEVSLYDDSDHCDRNDADGFYGVCYRTDRISPINGLNNYYVDIIVNKNNSEIVQEDAAYFTVVYNSACLPIINHWENPGIKHNLVYVSNTHNNSLDYQTDVADNIGKFASIAPFDAFMGEFNFYRINYNYDKTPGELIQEIKKECGFFDETRDFIIALDSNRDECERDGAVISIRPETIYLNPNPLANRDLNYSSPYLALEDFCSYTLTEPQMLRYAEMMSMPPAPVLLTPNNTVFSEYNASFEFRISDNLDDDIYYELYAYKHENLTELANFVNLTVDGLLSLPQDDYAAAMESINFTPIIYMVNGTAANGQLMNEDLDYMESGTYTVWIEATDADDNLNASNLITVFVLQKAEIEPEIIYPYNLSTISSLEPEILFRVNYLQNITVNYSIFVDNVLMRQGSVLSNDEASDALNIGEEGYHNITLMAEDRGISANSTIEININLAAPLLPMPSPPSRGYEKIILILLISILAFLASIAAVFYYKK